MRKFQTSSYIFHYLESASGVKIIVTTDLSVQDLQQQLWDIYALYSKSVVQNPNWQVDDCIEIPAFVSGVDSILLCLVCSARNSSWFVQIIPFHFSTNKQMIPLLLFLRLGKFQWLFVVKRPIRNTHLNMIHSLQNCTIAATMPPTLTTTNVT